jgi:hypothetical protein
VTYLPVNEATTVWDRDKHGLDPSSRSVGPEVKVAITGEDVT